MGLNVEDRILIKNLYITKGYGAVRLINEVPAKRWKKSTLNDFDAFETNWIDNMIG